MYDKIFNLCKFAKNLSSNLAIAINLNERLIYRYIIPEIANLSKKEKRKKRDKKKNKNKKKIILISYFFIDTLDLRKRGYLLLGRYSL